MGDVGNAELRIFVKCRDDVYGERNVCHREDGKRTNGATEKKGARVNFGRTVERVKRR